MQKRYIALILMIFCTLFTATGQIAWKFGAKNLNLDLSVTSIFSLITNWPLWLGFLLYGVGALLLIKSLSLGELSTVHPFLSLGFIWTIILASILLEEPITAAKLAGTTLIVAGTTFVFLGEKRKGRRRVW